MISRSTLVKVVVVFLVVQVLLYETGAFSALFKKPRSTNRDIEFEKSNWYDDTEDTAGTENTASKVKTNKAVSSREYDDKLLHPKKQTELWIRISGAFIKNKTLPELILHVETLHKSEKPVASFVFTNTLMKDNGSLLPVVEEALQSGSCSEIDRDTLSVYFKRTKSCLCLSPSTKKMILKPDAVYIPWVHFLFTYRSKHYTKEFSVPDDVGLSYHYRPNWKNYSACDTPVVENRSIEKYFKNITNCS
uniref:Glycosyltransferase family 92 protein n=1 Tax=Amphimedon queenslandica TaxID=400682 RepID=A0A1X7U8D1_AMPQE